jgi:hypothetical protein
MILAVEIPSCAMIFLPSFMKVSTGVQVILRFLLSNLNLKCANGMGSDGMIYIPSCMTIGSGI